MRGLEIRENPMGFTAIRLHYSADPEKDPSTEKGREWYDSQRALYPDPNTWEQEFEINFFVGAGARVFPQFTLEHHIRGLAWNTRKVVYRSWDFGWHAPVCILAQVDPDGRLCVLKEIVSTQTTTHDFAQLVSKRCSEWLPLHAAGFEDYCDPAGQQVKSIDSEKSERRDIDVLKGLGIHPKYEFGWSRKDGRTLIHRLLVLRNDQTPGLLVDQQGAPTVAQAFLGRYVYPVMKDGRQKEDPDDDTHPWADVMAAMRYMVQGLHGKLGLRHFKFGQTPPVPTRGLEYHGYGTVRRSARG